MRTVKIVFLILAPIILCGYFWSSTRGLAIRVSELEAQVEELTAELEDADEILQYVHVETGKIRGVTGPHWIIEGANVHVRSGSGSTRDGCITSTPGFPNCESLTGLGNLIVGYNEALPIRGTQPAEVRTGSNNLVVGLYHSYSSFAGFVAGNQNRVTGASASVSGGTDNHASGWYSSVSGGDLNHASGGWSSVSGGEGREAPDDASWAAGNLFEPN